MDNHIRLKDIARASNVSVSTVSRALRGSDRVSKATRNKIQAQAVLQNYVPNKTVKKPNLRNDTNHNDSTLIGNVVIVKHGKAHLFFSESIMEMAQASAKFGFTTNLIEVNAHNSITDCIHEGLALQPIAIILITWNDITASDAELIEKCIVPVVLINRYYPGRTNSVTLDDYAAGVQVARLFYNLGHRRIAHLVGPQVSSPIRERADGMRSELIRLNCFDPELFYHVNTKSMTESINMCIEQFLNLPEPVTAIWAYCDIAATIALTAIYATTRNVPGDVSIVGFNNTDQERILNMSTFDFRFSEVGRQAILLVHQLVTGATKGPVRICVVPTFIDGCTIDIAPKCNK